MENLTDIFRRYEMQSEIEYLKKNRKAEKLADIIADNLDLSEKKRNKIEKILKEYL